MQAACVVLWHMASGVLASCMTELLASWFVRDWNLVWQDQLCQHHAIAKR